MIAQFRQMMTNAGHTLREWWMRRRQSTRTLPRHLLAAFQNFNRYGLNQAAALAYYAVFSIFPLLLLMIVLLNRIVGPAIGQDQIVQGLSIFLPSATVSELQKNLAEALSQVGTFQFLAILGLIWSALGLFSNITQSIDVIFHVPSQRGMWRQRLLAFLMTLILIILILSSFITSGVLRLFAAFFLDQPSIWLTIGILFVPFSINVVVYILLFRFLPARHVHWEAIWPAAIFGALGWELAKAIFTWYVNNVSNFQVVYGTISTAIILLLSAYVLAAIFLISAELCSQLNEWILERPPLQRSYLSSRAVASLPESPKTVE
jgi:membrane protein